MMCKRSVLVFSLFVLWAVSSAHAVDGPFVGIDLGASVPTNGNYRAHVQEGATANPYLGESRPVASNDTADGRAQNRRVELRVE